MIFLIGMAFLGFLAQFQWIGQIVITGFAIYALVRRVPVNRVFSIALLMLGMVVLAIVLGNWLIAQNFAAYSFLAFFYGIVIMTFELRRELRVK
jgi:energy-converting hydrogenase Eha subunit C